MEYLVDFAPLSEFDACQKWKQIVAKNYGKAFSEKLPEELIEYNPDNFLYVKTFFASSGENFGQNRNHMYFPEEALKEFSASMIGKGVYIEHNEDIPDLAVGIVLDSFYSTQHHRSVAVLAVDRKAYPSLVKKLEDGEFRATSMTCVCLESICSVCGHKVGSDGRVCSHLKDIDDQNNGKEPKHPVPYVEPKPGKPEYCYIGTKPIFLGISFVKVPADENSQILSVSETELNEPDYGYLAEEITVGNKFFSASEKTGFRIVEATVKEWTEDDKPLGTEIFKKRDAEYESIMFMNTLARYLERETTAHTYFTATDIKRYDSAKKQIVPVEGSINTKAFMKALAGNEAINKNQEMDFEALREQEVEESLKLDNEYSEHILDTIQELDNEKL